MDTKGDGFPDLFNKYCSMSDRFLQTGSEEDRRLFAVCITELYNRSHHLARLAKAIADADITTNDGMDKLLGDLVDLKVELYDEMLCWMKDLKRPLQKVIDQVEEQLPDTDERP